MGLITFGVRALCLEQLKELVLVRLKVRQLLQCEQQIQRLRKRETYLSRINKSG